MKAPGAIRLWLLAISAGAFLLLPGTGCRTARPLLPVDLTEPGWRLEQGQALWQFKRGAPEIAGEFLIATHPDGRSLVQFSKTPFPIFEGTVSPAGWSAHIAPEGRRFSGRGQPPGRLIWLHLPEALRAGALPVPWEFALTPEGRWTAVNSRTGERLEGVKIASGVSSPVPAPLP
jgi:hypothetical protein